jgi:hypothetical protein
LTKEEFTVNTDGSFDFSPAERFFVSFLVDTETEDLNKVVGLLGITAGSGHWQLFDKEAFIGNLELGSISLSENSIVLVSEKTLEEINLTVDTTVASALAKLDDPVRSLKNYINSGCTLAANITYRIVNTSMASVIDQFSNPTDGTYQGYQIQILPMVAPLTEADDLLLAPPGTVSFEGIIYDSENPIAGNFLDLTEHGFGTSFEFGYGEQSSTLLQDQTPGAWILSNSALDQIPLDLSCVNMWNESQTLVGLPVPAVRTNTDDQGKILSFNVEWKVWNEAEQVYNTIDDFSFLSSMFAYIGLATWNEYGTGNRVDDGFLISPESTEHFPTKEWYFTDPSEYRTLIVEHLAVGYMVGDVGVNFIFRDIIN